MIERVVPVPSASPHLSGSLWRVPVPWTGVVGCGVPWGLPNDAYTAHGVQVFRRVQSFNTDEQQRARNTK